ncbi:MAG: hypothetical protein HRF45_11740 [Fimbriimonadia bacterium]
MSNASSGNKKTVLIIALVVVLIAVAAVAVMMFMPSGGGEEQGPPMAGGFEGMPAGDTMQPGREAPEVVPVTPVAGVAVKKRTAEGIPEGSAAYPRIRYVARADPFSVLPVEMAADERARQQQLLAMLGDFQLFAEPKPKPVNPALIPVEPQPYRRLSGIVRGEAVAAILEVPGVSDPVVVQPGDKVGEWTVRSIDNEKLVLVRSGDKRPNTVEVKLEALPATLASSGTGVGAGGPTMGGMAPGPGAGIGGPTVGPGAYGPRGGRGPAGIGPSGGGGPSR